MGGGLAAVKKRYSEAIVGKSRDAFKEKNNNFDSPQQLSLKTVRVLYLCT